MIFSIHVIQRQKKKVPAKIWYCRVYRPIGSIFIFESFPLVELGEDQLGILIFQDRLETWLRQDEIHRAGLPQEEEEKERGKCGRSSSWDWDGIQEEEEEESGNTGLFSNSHTVLILTVVVGCFGVLWPKIFSPMFFGDGRSSHQDISEDPIGSCKIFCSLGLSV